MSAACTFPPWQGQACFSHCRAYLPAWICGFASPCRSRDEDAWRCHGCALREHMRPTRHRRDAGSGGHARPGRSSFAPGIVAFGAGAARRPCGRPCASSRKVGRRRRGARVTHWIPGLRGGMLSESSNRSEESSLGYHARRITAFREGAVGLVYRSRPKSTRSAIPMRPNAFRVRVSPSSPAPARPGIRIRSAKR